MTDRPLTDREAFEVTVGSFLADIAAGLNAVADTLLVLAQPSHGIDAQAIDAARDRVNLRSLRRNHPNPEDL